MKQPSRAWLVLAIALTCVSGRALPAGLIIIVNPGVKLAADEVRDVFLGEKQISADVKLVPVDNAALQEQFLSQVMKLGAAKYSASWTKRSFRDGLIPPAVKGSDPEVIEFVKRVPGAAGYVASPPGPGVRIVE